MYCFKGLHGHFFLEVLQKSEILKNAVSERWCTDSRLYSNVVVNISFAYFCYETSAILQIRTECLSEKHRSGSTKLNKRPKQELFAALGVCFIRNI